MSERGASCAAELRYPAPNETSRVVGFGFGERQSPSTTAFNCLPLEEEPHGQKWGDSPKWLLGRARQDNKNRSHSESAAALAANLPNTAHRKSFEMKNIWNYIRNQSSLGGSPQKQPQPQQPQSQMDANYCRFSLLKGTSAPYSSATRGNSIPETVLLGLLPVADLAHGKRHGRQRNSAPTIIQKDKTEKAWERMLKMKSNEKKVKRKTSRLMLKNWVTTSRTAEESTSTTVTSTYSGGRRRESLVDNCLPANVVVIIDKVSPTTNGIDHLSMLNDTPPMFDSMDGKDLYDPYDPSCLLAQQSFDDIEDDEPPNQILGDCTAQDCSPICHRNLNSLRFGTTISEVAECEGIDSLESEPVAMSNGKTGPPSCSLANNSMSSGFTAVSSPIGMAAASSSSKRINSERSERGHSSGSFSRDNSGDTASGDSGDQKGRSESNRCRPGSSSENAFEGDDDVIDLMGNGADSDRPSLHGRGHWRKPESCSSYSSLNNDESASLHSQEGSQTFDLPHQFAAGGMARPQTNYPRKYSLTVPGEPRHMRLLNRRESGSRSPLNSSCGGDSETSTPSRSISNSINDDQSSCSSGALNAISIELNRKCALSVDSLLLKTATRSERSPKDHDKPREGLPLDALCKNLRGLTMSSGSTSGGNEVTPTSDSKTIGDETPDMEPDVTKMPKRRKDSVTQLIASFLLPDSLYQKFGASLSSDRIHHSSANSANSALHSISPRSIFSSKPKSSSSNDTHASVSKADLAGPSQAPPRTRKGSIAQITSASAGRIVRRILRRTHSAGCSKDVPAYALFLKEEKASARKKRKERKRGRKQAPALEDMKQRLRFLRRRHTDSSLHASTVRPPRNEVEKWSKSFRDLMTNRYGCALFRAFLAREYSEENIEFWIACEEYRKARSSKLHHKAKKIFDNFLAVRAPKEVNLDHQLRSDIMQALTAPNKTTFDEAQRKIQSLLESDSYLRFIASDIYTELLRSEQERKKDEEEEEKLDSDERRTPTPSSSHTSHKAPRMGKHRPISSNSNLAATSFPEDEC